MNTMMIFLMSTLLLFAHPDTGSKCTDDGCKVLLPDIDETYEGDCKKGLANGEGKATGTDIYSGQFKDGLPHGTGTYTWANGDVFTGTWKKGEKDGAGKLTQSDGKVINGYWDNDEYIGVDKKPYEIIQQGIDILRLTFRRADDTSNKVEIKFIQNQVELPVRITDVTGGFRVLPSNTEYRVFTVPVQEFPFQGYMQFDVPGTLSNTLISNVDLEFRISQPGYWIVRVEMRATN